jgi:WS/DGAT/MGAT family acyltransferase
MARYAYDRLTALDYSFLALEKPNAYMHVASTGIFESGLLKKPNGGIDFAAIKQATEGVLHEIPRYRQKLAWIPIDNHPVWIDDDRFNLDYHMRHTSLPRPGTLDQLKRMAARIMAQQLDRSRPLWETWVVEGLEGDRFAIISKIHHCMIDGISGVDLMTVLLSPTPEHVVPEPPSFVPRPTPSRLELLRTEVLRRLSLPFEAVRNLRAFTREAQDLRREVLTRVRAIADTLGTSLRSPSETPLNRAIGPHRRFDWFTMQIADIKEVRKILGGSLNDVVLTTVAGAVRRFMQRRNVNPEALDFRVMAPVSVRTQDERGQLGNRVSAWFVPLPLDEEDPRKQLERITQTTAELKEAKQAVGASALTQVADWTPSTLLSLGARNMTRLLPFNLVVTNVPGPQIPLYMMGAKMVDSFPNVPLADNLGLGIALFSYDGRIYWGFNADYDLVPDLDLFVGFVEESFREIQRAAGIEPKRPSARPPGVERSPAERIAGEPPSVEGDEESERPTNGASADA